MIRVLPLPFLFAALALAGCATYGPHDAHGRADVSRAPDPWERTNRAIFKFNDAVDRAVIKPVAKGYVHLFPAAVRDGFRHLLDNLDEPLIAANCLLQGRVRDGGVTLGRIVVNTTIGVAGIRDVATRWHWRRQIGDFGQTLWSWHIASGPYLVLPVFGPTTPRDAIGGGIDTYLDPVRYMVRNSDSADALSISRTAGEGIDERARNLQTLDAVRSEAIDYYASLRSLFLQNREAQLTRSEPKAQEQSIPAADFYNDPGK